MQDKIDISVIVSTYNAVEWLHKTLEGYRVQDFLNFEVVVADDGSGFETKQLLQRLQRDFPVPIVHVWHEDRGFQKTSILNKAIQATHSDYILMSDGDCIPRKDFLKVHYQNRRPGFFLSGGYYKLPMNISREISIEAIRRQECFDLQWLKKRGLRTSIKNKKLTAGGLKARFLNHLTPTNASWNGHNSSGWKKDILAVNGFDERMQYGGEDRELGERLMNLGVRPKQIRYSAICLHLDHSRGYKTREAIEKNLSIRKETRRSRSTWTSFGIKKF